MTVTIQKRFLLSALYGLSVFWAVCMTSAPVSAQSTQRELKVVQHVWGFDGRVQPGQFNPLAILLDNQTDDPIDATATLQRVHGMLNASGGQLTQQVFIAPTARRWIFFYPYISESQQSEWRLAFNGKKLQDIQQPRPAWRMSTDKKDQPPQVIILDRAGQISTQPPTVKHLQENIFPPYATVTFGLHTVFLDHVPDWEQPRQSAFMSWLKQGGRLHVLKDIRGEYPRFSGPMVDLNHPLDRFAIGSGIVLRHDVQRSGVTEDLVRRAMVVDTLKDIDKELEEQLEEKLYQTNQGIGVFVETEPSSIDDTLFRQMRELTMPEHAWWLIFLLALCYIGLIFPGCFVVSKKKNLHFLATYGAIVGLSLVFSVLFLVIGRRGYGETTNLQTLAVARAEDDSNWNIFQWNALFVTAGDNYFAQAPKQQAVIATANSLERQDALATYGNEAHIAMRIPPFSSQTFVTRRRISAEPWTLEIQNIESRTNNLDSLNLKVGGSIPTGDTTKYMVMSRRHVYEMKYNAKSKTLDLFGKRRAIAEFCQPQYSYDYTNPWGVAMKPDDARTDQEIFYDDAIRMLMQRCLLDDLVKKPARFELPSDRVRVMVYTEAPRDFVMDISSEVKHTGRILFTKDVFLNGGPAGSQ